MATTWTYNGWRRESGTAAQRTMLILHIEEVEQYLAGFVDQGAEGFSSRKHESTLTEYLKRLEAKLRDYDSALGLGLTRNDPSFIQGKARL